MNNTVKYRNFIDYSLKLKDSMKNFEAVFWNKPPKQMGSFNVTMRNISFILDNLGEIKDTLDDMNKFVALDLEAKKNNRSARKASDIISSIRSELRHSYERLKEELFKQLEIGSRQCREVQRAIKDKDDRDRFSKSSREFLLMAFEAKTEKHRIPFSQEDVLEAHERERLQREHFEEERKINRTTEYEQQQSNQLDTALAALLDILARTPETALTQDIKREVKQIKKALPPKTVAIAKESLDRLRHSSHLILDLEHISSILNAHVRYFFNDPKLRKVNQQFEALKPLIEQAIQEERQRNMDIRKEHDDVQNKVDYATRAVKSYGDVIDGNARLEQEQNEIRNRTHRLYAENDRLKEKVQQAYEEMERIEGRPVDLQEWNDEEKIEGLHERALQDQRTIKENEQYMETKMEEQAVTSLPERYTDMKRTLQSMSNLHRVQLTEEQQLGGMSL